MFNIWFSIEQKELHKKEYLQGQRVHSLWVKIIHIIDWDVNICIL